MTDVDEDSGGTFCVPGAHRATNNPRGPADGITVSAPIPGEMQCRAPAGSVYIQGEKRHCPTQRNDDFFHLSNSMEHVVGAVLCCAMLQLELQQTAECGIQQHVTIHRVRSASQARIDGCRGGFAMTINQEGRMARIRMAGCRLTSGMRCRRRCSLSCEYPCSAVTL
jgi:hypothetical protein